MTLVFHARPNGKFIDKDIFTEWLFVTDVSISAKYSILFSEYDINYHTRKIEQVALYIKQGKTMNRDTQNFAENNYTIAGDCQCHPCINVGGRKHTLQKSLLRTSAATIIFVSISVAAGFRRYTCVWRNYFEDAINLGIGGDCVENVLWRVQDTSLLDATSFVLIHCSTNNINQNQPKDIAGRILKIVKPLPRNILKKYHQYWLVAKGQDIIFLAKNNQ